MKLALGLDVQTNAKEGKFMSRENSHRALVCKAKADAKRVGVCFASNTAWSCGRMG